MSLIQLYQKNPYLNLGDNKKNILISSNSYIIDKIKRNKPFIISRIGIGSETHSLVKYLKNDYSFNNGLIYTLSNNAGIYTNNVDEVIAFCKEYNDCLNNSDALLFFSNHMRGIQHKLIDMYKLQKLDVHIISPFFFTRIDNHIPWTHHLLGKKVLVINPFVTSMKKQMDNNFKMYKNKDIFLNGQEFIFYKSYQTSAGNHLHGSWIKTFQIMCNDIKKIDFDIALLGCGGYGLPLCNFIKTKLNKSAIYLGGVLQILFGVGGKRWNEQIYKIQKKEGCRFIRPSGNELTKNRNKVENACYW